MTTAAPLSRVQTSLCPATSFSLSGGTLGQEMQSLQCVVGLLLVGQAQNTSPRRHPPKLAPLDMDK